MFVMKTTNKKKKKKMENSHLLFCSFVRSFVHQSHLDEDRCWHGMCLCTHIHKLTFFLFLSVYVSLLFFLLIERVDGRGRAKNCFVAFSPCFSSHFPGNSCRVLTKLVSSLGFFFSLFLLFFFFSRSIGLDSLNSSSS